jgi:hypothetical protein
MVGRHISILSIGEVAGGAIDDVNPSPNCARAKVVSSAVTALDVQLSLFAEFFSAHHSER